MDPAAERYPFAGEQGHHLGERAEAAFGVAEVEREDENIDNGEGNGEAARGLAIAFAVVYVLVLALHFGDAEGGFGTLAQVMALFTSKWVALSGWIHYLAFDLFVGAWIVEQGQKDGLALWRFLPALPLTFLFGPAGLLLFTLIRGRRA